MLKAEILIYHWPNYFFDPDLLNQGKKNLIKIFLARMLGRAKFVWVAHNVMPHDVANTSSVARRFINQLDGIVHLSHAGRDLVEQSYAVPARTKQLVTVHGRYEPITTPSHPRPLSPDDHVRAVTVGLIKPYKNLEAVINASRGISAVNASVRIFGNASDAEYANNLRTMALDNKVTIEIREALLSDQDIEAAMDASDLVLLPYKQILNSGSAFRALSRNRPIVAPNMGAFPELRNVVGEDWVYLYDGIFNASILQDAIRWLRETTRPYAPVLTNYDWDRVAADLRKFLLSI